MCRGAATVADIARIPLALQSVVDALHVRCRYFAAHIVTVCDVLRHESDECEHRTKRAHARMRAATLQRCASLSSRRSE